MNRSFYLTPIVLAIIVLWSCNRQSANQGINHIDLSENWKSAEKVLLSSIASDIEYIPLETTPDCLIGNHRSMQVTILDKYLVVHEHNKVMKLFDRQGKFLNTIGKLGKGPEEYIPLNKYYVDEKNDQIYLLSSNRKCMVYGFDGHFKNEIKLEEYADQIIVDNEGNIGLLYLAETVLLKDSAKLQWLTPEGIEKSSIPLYPGRQMGGGKLVGSNVQCYWYHNKLRFAEVPFDTVYQLDSNSSFQPVWSIESGPLKIPCDVLHSWPRFVTEQNDYTILFFLWESDNYFFLAGGYQNGIRKILYDKKTGLAQTVEIPKLEIRPEDSGFINDLDGGLPFWPKTTHNNLAISCLTPLDLLVENQNTKSDKSSSFNPKLAKKFKAMVESLDENDNPVVMIVKLN